MNNSPKKSSCSILKEQMTNSLITQTKRIFFTPIPIPFTIHQTTTTLIADAASKDEIQARVAQLKKELSETDSV
jgi:hypothetical protein